MKSNFRPWRRTRDLEDELSELAPQARPDFVRSLAADIDKDTKPARRPSFRVAFATGLGVSLLVAMASVGGFGYAATAAKSAAKAVKSILVANGDDGSVEVLSLSAGGDQYQPGFAWGDPSHNHDGAPGLRRRGGEFAPPLVAHVRGSSARVSTTVVLDEQAVLRVSVLDPSGRKLLLTQNGSSVGGDVSGRQTKTITYRVLVPRALRIALRIPANVLDSGRTYRIAVRATDPDGNVSSLVVPFHVQGATS
jgi:hypothetical protein